jgi:hypothetical protein
MIGLVLTIRYRQPLLLTGNIFVLIFIASPDVHPRGAGGDGMVGTVWLVEGLGYGRSYPFVPAYGGLLRSLESAADCRGPRRLVARHN